jgi:hypothetical protein
MTATEMYKAFNYAINQSNNFNLFTWDVAFWLNSAQDEMESTSFYQAGQKRSLNVSPISAYQDTAFSAEVMQPFIRSMDVYTDPMGFLAMPNGANSYVQYDSSIIAPNRPLQHLTAIGVYAEDSCTSRLYPVKMTRDNEIFPALGDPFTRPKFGNSLGGILTHNVLATYATKGPMGIPGYQLYPKQKLLVSVKYTVRFADIQIQNNAIDNQLIGNPQFILSPVDVNCEFPEFTHNEIVRRAVALYALSVPDYDQAQAEAAKVASGEN